MMQIIYVVMAIGLTVLITFGGVSYMNSDAPVRAISTRGIVAQYEALAIAVGSYKSANNGIYPERLEEFSGYLPKGGIPDFGPSTRGFRWTVTYDPSVRKSVLCLEINEKNSTNYEAVRNFARQIKVNNTEIQFGTECMNGVDFDINAPYSENQDKMIFTIRNF